MVIIIIILLLLLLLCRQRTDSMSRVSGGGLYLATQASKPCQQLRTSTCQIIINLQKEIE